MNIKNKVRSAVSRTVERLVRRSVVFRDTESKLRSAEARASRIEGENRELAERTTAIGRRLCNVSVQRPPDPMGRRLRVMVEIDAMILERGFLHGDDATVIKYIGRDIGARAAHEIRRANFQRWEV
ncbi:MAG: hypothetical protein WC551_12585 [Patescibacteria group bacterium]